MAFGPIQQYTCPIVFHVLLVCQVSGKSPYGTSLVLLVSFYNDLKLSMPTLPRSPLLLARTFSMRRDGDNTATKSILYSPFQQVCQTHARKSMERI